MAKKTSRTRSTKPVRKEREVEQNDNDGEEQEEGRDRGRGGESKFVNITKLFETKNNQDLMVGTCKPEYLGKLQDLLEEGSDTGVTFFVNLNGKWGPNLSATLAREQEGGGGRGDRGRRESFNDRSDERGSRRRPRF